ncbi:LytR/AlgR family response regulator transcription factor [Brevibacillus sp. SYSU BS000544]|uniref:LytR/AlgR family response regulator transcription factor n=1 Tax=Brevibacillus sp. SYSU BS000544 TaxID=3416443 RepID=UPI003CE527CB
MLCRTVVADSQQKFRNNLVSFLRENQLDVIGETGEGKQIKDYVVHLNPDIIFLEIDSSKIDGINLVKQLHIRFPQMGMVLIGRSTEFASFAFDMEAIDYLVKPITQERLFCCLKKIALYQKGVNDSLFMKNNKIGFRLMGEVQSVDQNHILFISSENRETKVYINNGSKIKVISIKESLISLESRLNPDIFIRTHRSFIINLNNVCKVYQSGQTFIATFNGAREVAYISRNCISEVYKSLNVI